MAIYTMTLFMFHVPIYFIFFMLGIIMKFPKDSEAHGPSPSEIPPNVESSQIKSVTGPEVTKKI